MLNYIKIFAKQIIGCTLFFLTALFLAAITDAGVMEATVYMLVGLLVRHLID